MKIIALPCCILFFSCRVAYIPNPISTPLFTDKNQFKAFANTANLQLAFSPIKHVGVMLNGMRRNFNDAIFSNDHQFYRAGKGYLAEAGIGGYGRLNQWLILESYVGIGTGKINKVIGTEYFKSEGNRNFIQLNLGYRDPYFELAISTRYSLVNYKNVFTNLTEEGLRLNNLYHLEKYKWSFIEPTLTLSKGVEYMKIQLQFGRALNLNSNHILYEKVILNAGLTIDLGRKYYD